MAETKECSVGVTDFYLSADGSYVGELGTPRRWCPDHPQGYKVHREQRISICSFEGFGADINQARELADRWCERARKAWEILTGGGA